MRMLAEDDRRKTLQGQSPVIGQDWYFDSLGSSLKKKVQSEERVVCSLAAEAFVFLRIICMRRFVESSWHRFAARIGTAFYKLAGAFLPDKTL